MRYVYLLQSISYPKKKYVGVTSVLEQRLRDHNAGRSPHTSRFTPWKVVVSIQFEEDNRAAEFEMYLKSGSGHAFARKHFW